MPSPIDFSALATNGFAFTIAMAWNNTIFKLINSIYGNTTCATITYAIVVTLLVIIIVYIINRVSKHVNDMKNALRKRLGTSNNNDSSKFLPKVLEQPYIRF